MVAEDTISSARTPKSKYWVLLIPVRRIFLACQPGTNFNNELCWVKEPVTSVRQTGATLEASFGVSWANDETEANATNAVLITKADSLDNFTLDSLSTL